MKLKLYDYDEKQIREIALTGCPSLFADDGCAGCPLACWDNTEHSCTEIAREVLRLYGDTNDYE